MPAVELDVAQELGLDREPHRFGLVDHPAPVERHAVGRLGALQVAVDAAQHRNQGIACIERGRGAFGRGALRRRARRRGRQDERGERNGDRAGRRQSACSREPPHGRMLLVRSRRVVGAQSYQRSAAERTSGHQVFPLR